MTFQTNRFINKINDNAYIYQWTSVHPAFLWPSSQKGLLKDKKGGDEFLKKNDRISSTCKQ